MVREIVKDKKYLSQVSGKFDRTKHKDIAKDLLDTAIRHKDNCLGLAAIQIGEPVNLIVVAIRGRFTLYRNPIIVKKSKETFEAQESCLSLEGSRKVVRHKAILIAYEDSNGKGRTLAMSGLVAQIVQHECDHLKGILI